MIKEQQDKIFGLQMKCVLEHKERIFLIESDEENPTLYFSEFDKYAQQIKEQRKTVIFVGKGFLFGQLD